MIILHGFSPVFTSHHPIQSCSTTIEGCPFGKSKKHPPFGSARKETGDFTNFHQPGFSPSPEICLILLPFSHEPWKNIPIRSHYTGS